MHTLVFDVYGTLVDLNKIVRLLEPRLGERSEVFCRQWRAKMLEYSYRMGLMRWYKPFSDCIRFAFVHTCETYHLSFTQEESDALMASFSTLPPFDDAAEVLRHFHHSDANCIAFSNAAQSDLDSVLENSGLSPFLDDAVSVESITIYKPSRIAYAYLLERIARLHQREMEIDSEGDEHTAQAKVLRMSERQCLPYVESGLSDLSGQHEISQNEGAPLMLPEMGTVWLISSNPFDVIGARVAGLQAVWIRRSAEEIFDPWGIEPTLTVANLVELYDVLKSKQIIRPT